jgi:hypothetical protein
MWVYASWTLYTFWTSPCLKTNINFEKAFFSQCSLRSFKWNSYYFTTVGSRRNCLLCQFSWLRQPHKWCTINMYCCTCCEHWQPGQNRDSPSALQHCENVLPWQNKPCFSNVSIFLFIKLTHHYIVITLIHNKTMLLIFCTCNPQVLLFLRQQHQLQRPILDHVSSTVHK